MSTTTNTIGSFDSNVFSAPGVRRKYLFIANGLKVQGILHESNLGDGIYAFECDFAFNAMHAPAYAQMQDLACLLPMRLQPPYGA